ncbi:hypothetical protein KTE44_19090 [Burkholderia multivorans]|nr:hypothetical protein [Burkholderia multivorans]
MVSDHRRRNGSTNDTWNALNQRRQQLRRADLVAVVIEKLRVSINIVIDSAATPPNPRKQQAIELGPLLKVHHCMCLQVALHLQYLCQQHTLPSCSRMTKAQPESANLTISSP